MHLSSLWNKKSSTYIFLFMAFSACIKLILVAKAAPALNVSPKT